MTRFSEMPVEHFEALMDGVLGDDLADALNEVEAPGDPQERSDGDYDLMLAEEEPAPTWAEHVGLVVDDIAAEDWSR